MQKAMTKATSFICCNNPQQITVAAMSQTKGNLLTTEVFKPCKEYSSFLNTMHKRRKEMATHSNVLA